jgi:chromosome segregation ATPase
MQKDIVVTREPRSKRAALNQCAYIHDQQQLWSQRKENLMSNIRDTEQKIIRLQATLEEYSKRIESIDTTQADWQSLLDRLKRDFQLTESEILEQRSIQLREKILRLERDAGVLKTGQTVHD